MRKQKLLEQLAALRTKHTTELDRLTLAAAGTEPVSPAEVQALTALGNEIKAAQAELDAINELETLAARRVAEEAKPKPHQPASVHDLAEDKPYDSFGEFLSEVAIAGSPNANIPPRLRAQAFAPTGSNVTTPSDGGYAVGKTFGDLIIRRVFDAGQIAGLCPAPLETDVTGKIEVPVLAETSRATGSRWGGVQVYRVGEANTVTESKPKIEGWTAEVAKLMGLWYATDRTLRNAPLMTQLANEAFASEMAWKIDSEIWGGNGVAQCLGFMNSGAKVTVTKETSQTAATVNLQNIMKMYNRMPARLISRAVWLINQEVFPQIQQLALTAGNGMAAAFMPPGGISGAPYGSIFGRPIIPVEHAEALGTEGDIVFVNLADTYRLIQQGGLASASSIHVRFLYHETAFRWTWEISGKPTWTQALSPLKGSATMSPYITLQTRS